MMEYPQSEANKQKAKRYCQRFARMAADRMNWENTWQEVVNYTVPRKNDIINFKTPGQKRGHELFDTTAIMSNQLLSAALHSMLTNPALRFFDLRAANLALNEDEEVKLWLQAVADRMYQLLNASNFQTEIHEIYIDLGSIGTACLYIGEHKEKIIHFAARAMKEIFVDENNLGVIDVVHRQFSWKLRQIVQEFGEEVLPAELLKRYKEGDEESRTILHCVEPMEDAEYKARGSVFKYSSCYLLKDSEYILKEEPGFREFPFAVPRWTKASGEVLGRGPGMDMLPDTKMVNKMMETTLKGGQKTVDPPLMVQDDGVIGQVRLTPGGITVVRPMLEQPIRPLIVDARVDFGIQLLEDTRRRIRAGFFVDQLQLREGPQMTAQEVRQRAEESMRLMGPVLGRQHHELLRPMIDRVFAIGVRRGQFPPAPRQLQGQQIDVFYSSLIARAQRMSEGENLTRAIAVGAPIFQSKPETLDLLNGDESIRYIFDIYGVPQKTMNDRGAIEEIRAARAEAQAKAAQEAADAHEAEVVNKTLPAVAQMEQARAARGEE